MFDEHSYVPILKGRDGEYGALNRIKEQAKSQIIPLIELPPIRWDFETETPARNLDAHLKRIAKKLLSAWGTTKPFFIDFLWLSQSERMEDGSHPINYIFNASRKLNLNAIPVAGLIRDHEYLEACQQVISQDKRGVCLRIQREDFTDFQDLTFEINATLNKLGTVVKNVDLLL